MKKVINVLFILICFNCIVWVLSCSRAGEEPNPVKIGINEWTGYDPFILADKTDLFPTEILFEIES